MKKLFAVGTTALMALGIALAMPLSANATEEVCTPSKAWTETIEHPAQGEPTTTVDNPDYIEGTPAVWANFSPNDKKATFTGPPTYPTDERGTWHDHGKLPGGHAGPDGVYAKGNPDKGGNWFYRQAAVPAVGEPTVEVPNPDYVEAWTEKIDHEAVVCDEEPDPTTYLPTCTTVTWAAVIEGDGVLAVAGNWATTHIQIPVGGTLADIGSVLDIEADPIQFVGLHIDTEAGTIVYEEEPSYAGKLWSNHAWEGVEPGMGYAAFGTIEEFIHLNGDEPLNAVYLLYTHPEESTTTVESFTIGCTSFAFEPKKAEPVPPVTEKPATDKPEELAMTGPGAVLGLGALGTILLGGGTLLARRFG